MRTSTSGSKEKWEQKWKRARRSEGPAPARREPPPMSAAEVRQWWEHMRADDWWQSQMPISYNAIAAVIGVVRSVPRDVLTGGRQSRIIDHKMAKAILAIEAREFCFPRPSRAWEIKKLGRHPFFVTIQRPEYPLVIGSIADRAEWTLHARCSCCGGNKFLPVFIDGRPRVACYRCVPPSQYQSAGVRRQEKSLIHEALKKYY